MRSYIAKYREAHHVSNFAGNLLSVKREYVRSTGETKKSWSDQFNAIVDNVVMSNGVKKTTYPMRHNTIVSKVLSHEGCRIAKDTIRVLDVPCSIGTSSLDTYKLLAKYYTISAYVLGDLYLRLYYDRRRECIYDDQRNLVQVKLTKSYFSIYRPHAYGDVYNMCGHALLFPITLVARYLKKKYEWKDERAYDLIPLIHPDVEARLKDGVLSLREIDVFKEIEGTYDLIISFNLLQRNYFPKPIIEMGVQKLSNALNEEGLLIMGNTESFAVSRKTGAGLVLIEKVGEF